MGPRSGDDAQVVFSVTAVTRRPELRVDCVRSEEALLYFASSDTRSHVAASDIPTPLDYALNTPMDAPRNAGSVKPRPTIFG